MSKKSKCVEDIHADQCERERLILMHHRKMNSWRENRSIKRIKLCNLKIADVILI